MPVLKRALVGNQCKCYHDKVLPCPGKPDVQIPVQAKPWFLGSPRRQYDPVTHTEKVR